MPGMAPREKWRSRAGGAGKGDQQTRMPAMPVPPGSTVKYVTGEPDLAKEVWRMGAGTPGQGVRPGVAGGRRSPVAGLAGARPGREGFGMQQPSNDMSPFYPGQEQPFAAPQTFDNQAQNDPDLDYTIGELRKRYEGDGGAARAIDLAGGKIREASLGEGRALAVSQAARGVSGTGAGALQYGDLASRTLSKVAGAASDISLARERDKDSMLSQIAGAAATRSGTNLANRQLALNQWETVQANRRAQESAKLARQMALLEMLRRGAA